MVKVNRKVLVPGATLLIAAAAGHLVQNADRYLGDSGAAVQTAAAVPAPTPRFVGEVTPLSATADAPAASAGAVGRVALPVAPAVLRPLPDLGPEAKALSARLSTLEKDFSAPPSGEMLNPFGMACESTLTASPAPAAMVDLALDAPCANDAAVIVTHDQLRFAERLSPTGTLRISVPALEKEAVFVLQIDGGEVLTAAATVPDASEYERVALQWQGDNAMHIHAYEFGAGYLDDGHVWADAPRAPAIGAAAKGGFLTALGGNDLPAPQQAEVYSYPRGEARGSGVVRVSIEAEVTHANCGREISAETLQPGIDGRFQEATLTLAVPACDAVGEFLVLKNILRDLKLASN